MARAALEWSLEESAAAAGVSRRTVLRFERYYRYVKPELIEALRRVCEEAGVRFIDRGSDVSEEVLPSLHTPRNSRPFDEWKSALIELANRLDIRRRETRLRRFRGVLRIR